MEQSSARGYNFIAGRAGEAAGKADTSEAVAPYG